MRRYCGCHWGVKLNNLDYEGSVIKRDRLNNTKENGDTLFYSKSIQFFLSLESMKWFLKRDLCASCSYRLFHADLQTYITLVYGMRMKDFYSKWELLLDFLTVY